MSNDHASRPRRVGTLALLRWFDYDHLPEHLAGVSRLFHDVAHELVRRLDDGPELWAGLRKLVEAKDCAVRAAILRHEWETLGAEQ